MPRATRSAPWLKLFSAFLEGMTEAGGYETACRRRRRPNPDAKQRRIEALFFLSLPGLVETVQRRIFRLCFEEKVFPSDLFRILDESLTLQTDLLSLQSIAD